MTDRLLQLPYHQIDAFTRRVFGGNPAAVVLLDAWLDDARLQAIAAEHNLSETAFVVPGSTAHGLRWFTPTREVDLCGHATLATAFALLECETGFDAPLVFTTRRAGALRVDRHDGRYWLDLPARPAVRCDRAPADVEAALGATVREWHAASNHLAVFDTAEQVAALQPDMRALAACGARDNRGVIATAPADDGAHDFVSRYFVPFYGVDEDPVTGSAHCTLTPYWACRLGRIELRARQISARGGEIHCRQAGERVHLGGHAVRYASGTITLDCGKAK